MNDRLECVIKMFDILNSSSHCRTPFEKTVIDSIQYSDLIIEMESKTRKDETVEPDYNDYQAGVKDGHAQAVEQVKNVFQEFNNKDELFGFLTLLNMRISALKPEVKP